MAQVVSGLRIAPGWHPPSCWDNAPTESWFNSFKNKRYHGDHYASHDDVKAESFEYIEVFYVRKRQYSRLGYRSPDMFIES
ncbi:MAG: IS3 family transposase [Betaproteobacteria bacterium]|nr:IS3 family transposase [Betaproteobacteria bacterium]MBK8317413.1 IS3 family transposase [Betaproteobacteria bacterium]